jgi:hypothetical protein
MALPTSGAMSLKALQTEYGGVNPVSLKEYYRGGLYVPYTVSTTTGVAAGAWSSFTRTGSTWIGYSGAFGSIGTDWVIVSLGSSIHNSRVMWGGSSLSPIVYNNTVTSIVSGAYEYGKGSFGATLHFGTKNFPETVTSYSIRRRTKATTTTTTINVNTNVAQIGTGYQLLLAQSFYGGRKT